MSSAYKIPFTTERFYPEHAEIHGEELYVRHLHRYEWVESFLNPNDYVLEAGCGSGAFDFILMRSCGGGIGIDVCRQAINYAVKQYEAKWLGAFEYKCMDASKMKFEDDRMFSKIIAIEMLEHLSDGQQIMFMKKVCKYLTDGGMFLMTTPVKGKTPCTKYHQKEFTWKELKKFLRCWFENVVRDKSSRYGVPNKFMLVRAWGLR